jgi:AraC family transcriptional activator of pyochelin receptor
VKKWGATGTIDPLKVPILPLTLHHFIGILQGVKIDYRFEVGPLAAEEVPLNQRERRSGVMQSYRFGSGMDLHIADFVPSETIVQRFETGKPLLRFYFHVLASGHWDLCSPYRSTTQKRLTHRDGLSSILFYPEIEGKMVLPREDRQFHLSIYITPSQLNTYLKGCLDPFPSDLRDIAEGCLKRGFAHAGSLSPKMDRTIQQIVACPYTGPIKTLYMESKAMELIVHKLAQTASPPENRQPLGHRLDPHEAHRIRHAMELLCRDLEHPPKLFELAQAAGTNHSRLNAGCRELYGTTVFGYLRRQRLMEARRLLEEEALNVTEAALSVGYNSLSSFSKAFSEYFGRQPMTYRKKKGNIDS